MSYQECHQQPLTELQLKQITAGAGGPVYAKIENLSNAIKEASQTMQQMDAGVSGMYGG